MQIYAHDHVEGHPQKKKEVLSLVKSSDQLSESELDS